ncbi:unnamed protein product [Penicillium salamii]|uniref:Restriction endonuclease domain-containing protein n=1 Tax=Penicillium salamii TaxID=1612424 RepID=A0A9W4NWJ6_9EURO|nr:unnamed protein product [Penicillium salamii]
MPARPDQLNLTATDSARLSVPAGSTPPLRLADPETTVTLKSPSLLQLTQEIANIKNIHLAAPDPLKARVSYLLATELNESTFHQLWSNSGFFHGVTATLWKRPRTALYRIMPNNQHECIRDVFFYALGMLLLEMNLSALDGDFKPSGSGRIYGVETSKEPDFAFRPGPRLASGDLQPPSLILEVGVSESYPQLLQDVNWWSESAPVRPGIVVLIYVKTRPAFRVNFEVWTESPAPSRYNTRSAPPTRLQRSQHVYVEANVVHGGPLRLDFSLLMRRAPTPPLEHDVIFTDQQLLVIAEEEE